MAKEVTIKKIYLDTLIKALVNIYNTGADYVDLIGTTNEQQDVIQIIVKDEYMSKNDDDDDDEIEQTDISDETDLNELI